MNESCASVPGNESAVEIQRWLQQRLNAEKGRDFQTDVPLPVASLKC
jgi:hypothetical protein